eukprot:Nk52_evm13s1224 gene=Nk52_evmTU13s1224
MSPTKRTASQRGREYIDLDSMVMNLKFAVEEVLHSAARSLAEIGISYNISHISLQGTYEGAKPLEASLEEFDALCDELYRSLDEQKQYLKQMVEDNHHLGAIMESEEGEGEESMLEAVDTEVELKERRTHFAKYISFIENIHKQVDSVKTVQDYLKSVSGETKDQSDSTPN